MVELTAGRSVASKAALMVARRGVWRAVLSAEKSGDVKVATSVGLWECLWAGQRAGMMAVA